MLSKYISALKFLIRGTDLGGNGTTTSPGYLKLVSADGTAYYVFAENDGTLKIHTAVPTDNTDGSEVGAQS